MKGAKEVIYGFGFGGLEGAMFSAVPVFIAIVFAAVLGMFLFMAVQGVRTWNRNNHSPRLTVPATVTAKRTDVTHHHHRGAGNHHHTSTSTRYYATFQVESGDRMELSLSGLAYGLLAEGDRGNLTFQGTRYLSFERT